MIDIWRCEVERRFPDNADLAVEPDDNHRYDVLQAEEVCDNLEIFDPMDIDGNDIVRAPEISNTTVSDLSSSTGLQMEGGSPPSVTQAVDGSPSHMLNVSDPSMHALVSETKTMDIQYHYQEKFDVDEAQLDFKKYFSYKAPPTVRSKGSFDIGWPEPSHWFLSQLSWLPQVSDRPKIQQASILSSRISSLPLR